MKKIYLSLLIVLCSCGYKFQDSSKSLSIASIKGDHEGFLTSEIVRQISASRAFSYTNQKGDMQLTVKILDITDSQIGYMHDRKDDGKVKKNILPNEGRYKIKAEFSLTSSDGTLLAGPFIALADVDYDYIEQDSFRELSFIDKNGNRALVSPFSLGQLEDKENAKEAAKRPLYKALAKKIVDAISLCKRSE